MKRVFLILSMVLCTGALWADECEPILSEALAEFSFQPYRPEGALNGNAVFSVSADVQVFFSKGNLQYRASNGTAYSADCADCLKHEVNDGNSTSYAQGEWRFAEHQWDYIGSSNTNVSKTNQGWIDLFMWATSGWNSGANQYEPWTDVRTHSNYFIKGDGSLSMTGENRFADWGVYNAISNGGNRLGLWRTLTGEEMDYLLNFRTDALSKRGYGTIEGTKGLVLLPDEWTLPTGCEFSTTSHTTYSLEDWEKMEAAGAVFLPAAGWRQSKESNGMIYEVNTNGYYWTASPMLPDSEYNFIKVLSFDASSLTYPFSRYRDQGSSVRLVSNIK